MARTMLAGGFVFPESPRWHEGKLWLSDMHKHRVSTCDLASGKVETVADFDDKPSGIGYLPDGMPIVVMMRTRVIVRLEKSGPVVHADLNALAGQSLNDMVVDVRGNAYVGNRTKQKAPEGDPRSLETVVLVRPDGTVQTVAQDMVTPNGSVVTPDGRTLVVAESVAKRLTAFDIRDDGTLANRRVYAELHTPADGICLDAEGAVWYGAPMGEEFVRVAEGGKVLQRVPLEKGKWGVACVLGGTGRRTLIMLTAFNTLENSHRLVDAKSDALSESRGFIETMEVDVPGAGIP